MTATELKEPLSPIGTDQDTCAVEGCVLPAALKQAFRAPIQGCLVAIKLCIEHQGLEHIHAPSRGNGIGRWN